MRSSPSSYRGCKKVVGRHKNQPVQLLSSRRLDLPGKASCMRNSRSSCRGYRQAGGQYKNQPGLLLWSCRSDLQGRACCKQNSRSSCRGYSKAADRHRCQPFLLLASRRPDYRGTEFQCQLFRGSKNSCVDSRVVCKLNSQSWFQGYKQVAGRHRCRPFPELEFDRSVDQGTKFSGLVRFPCSGTRHRLTGILQAEQSVFVPSVQGGSGSMQVPAFPGAEV
jgi:hypothetical protein